VFWLQFETVAEQNCWTHLEKSTYLIKGRATDVLHGVRKGATYEETLEALKDCFGDQHLVAAYRSQLKTGTQGVVELLQEFTTAFEELAYRAYPALREDNIKR
jgi:hypothetical protein